MIPIFNRTGEAVGWLKEPFIFEARHCVAFLAGEAVYAIKGTYIGRFCAGIFRDKDDRAVAFVDGATTVGVPVEQSTLPDANILSIAPLAPSLAAEPYGRVSWGRSWAEYMHAP